MNEPNEDAFDADPLYQAALAVEQDLRLTAEMAEWEEAMLTDGIESDLRLPPAAGWVGRVNPSSSM
jgi:hypothetical protein